MHRVAFQDNNNEEERMREMKDSDPDIFLKGPPGEGFVTEIKWSLISTELELSWPGVRGLKC